MLFFVLNLSKLYGTICHKIRMSSKLVTRAWISNKHATSIPKENELLLSIMAIIVDSVGINLIRSDCLLTGVGNELHQYYLNTNNDTIHKRKPLQFRSKIMGISTGEQENGNSSRFVVIHGGRELAVAILSEENDICIVKRLTLNDWISSVRVYKTVSDTISFCVVTAHSIAIKVEMSSNGKWRFMNKANCVDKCTLYCSLIVGNEWSNTIVLGGSAFGELIIWNVNDGSVPCEVLHRLTCHNGVIFSINCSISHKLITTTSDDRSLKVWKINCPSDKFDWSSCSLESMKSLFGHTARIFNHKILFIDGHVYIVTVGEDSSVCIWNCDGRLIHKKVVSSNVPLWNLDYDAGRQYLFVCGADGNVHQVNLKGILESEEISTAIVSIDGLIDDEHPVKLVVMSDNANVVIVTNKQNLYYKSLHPDSLVHKWEKFELENIISKITSLETFRNYLAIAGYRYLVVYQFENGIFKLIFKHELSTETIRCIKFLRDMELLVCDCRGNCTLVNLSDGIHRKIEFDLPVCKERWFTAAARLERYLIIGDRCGNIHLYEISEGEDSIELRYTLKHVHGNMGSTSILFDTKNKLKFTTAGHDSKLRIISINNATKELEPQYTRETPVRWCDKIISLDNDHSNMILLGFNDSHFIAWKNDNSFRFEFDCGGGHRYWDLYLDTRTQRANLFYIRNKKLFAVQFILNDCKSHPFHITNKLWHSRPCNTMHIIKSCNGRHLIISGGDDNVLRISHLNIKENNGESMKREILRHEIDMNLHISNIRTIFTIPVPIEDEQDKKWLIFSAGGRAQICVTEIKVMLNQPLQMRELCDFMIRPKDVERKRYGGAQQMYFDPETRFMSIVAFVDKKTNKFSVLVGCSDGFIRYFEFVDGTISLKESIFYGRCITHLFHFNFMDEDYLISIGTDGLIAFWVVKDFNRNSKPFYTHRHHESAINSFDASFNGSNNLIIATGGDDQAIVVSVLKLNINDGRLGFSIVNKKEYPYNHSAQVNGVRICIRSHAIYTVSVDQKIMRIDLDKFSCMQIGYTCISDAKGLELCNEMNSIFVYGCGMQALPLLSIKKN